MKGYVHKFTYFMRTIPDIKNLLYPLDAAIDGLIKTIFEDHDFNTTERKLWSLPVRLGGLGIPIPSEMSDHQYANSRLINEKLSSKVRAQVTIYEDISSSVNQGKSEVKSAKAARNQEMLDGIVAELGNSAKGKALEASMEKGASSWLNALPLKKHGYNMDKESFRVALYTRYGIPLKRMPSHCPCGCHYSVEHALNCKKGGFISNRHNEIRRITADLLKEVCIDVEEEPLLQEITGEVFKARTAKVEKDARLDISARGFWMRGQKVFCDVRVFNPLTKCHRSKPLSKVHDQNEKEKKVKYAARITEVEHGSFTPLVFSCFGGMSRECSSFYRKLAEKLAEKRTLNLSEAICFIRTKLSFSLAKSMVLCIRGSRSVRNSATSLADTDIKLANSEACLKPEEN